MSSTPLDPSALSEKKLASELTKAEAALAAAEAARDAEAGDMLARMAAEQAVTAARSLVARLEDEPRRRKLAAQQAAHLERLKRPVTPNP